MRQISIEFEFVSFHLRDQEPSIISKSFKHCAIHWCQTLGENAVQIQSKMQIPTWFEKSLVYEVLKVLEKTLLMQWRS